MTSTLFESNIFFRSHRSRWDGRGQALCRYDTIGLMRVLAAVRLVVLCLAPVAKPAIAQNTADDPVTVSTDHPRLFLRPQRLRLLRRERERSSMRWQQF